MMTAKPGTARFSIMEYGDAGDELAESKFVRQLKSGTNVVNATMHGKVGTVDLSIANPYYFTGKAAKQEVTVTALDNGGAVIVGPDAYDSPIVVKNSDRSGSTKLSRTKLASPADRLYITYTGHGCAHATLSAESALATFEPAIVPTVTYTVPSGHDAVGNMVLGNDGAVWFMESRAIGRVTTNGQINEYAIASTSNEPNELLSGPDGHVWFATGWGRALEPSADSAAVERVNDDGSISIFPLPTPPPNRIYDPAEVISGPQSDLWIAYGDGIYSLTTTGAYSTQYQGGGEGRFFGLAEGPDGNIWMSGTADTGTPKYKYAPGGTPAKLTGPIADMNAHLFVNAQGTLYLLGLYGAAEINVDGTILQRFAIPRESPGTSTVGAGSIWIPWSINRPGAYPGITRIRLSDNSVCSYLLTSSKVQPFAAISIGSDGNLWFSSGKVLGKAALPSM
ncbi:MAG TPA: hypothetical protein VFE36_00500 [Candidatus Baltobacteraceae bacterium]|nr:hypothetical protein [Candidatus Baltobacteraceae bacterium]